MSHADFEARFPRYFFTLNENKFALIRIFFCSYPSDWCSKRHETLLLSCCHRHHEYEIKFANGVVGHRTSSSTKLSSNQYHCYNWYLQWLTKLISGPKTNSPEMIAKLRKAGMNIVRMNFSHGSYEVHTSMFASNK